MAQDVTVDMMFGMMKTYLDQGHGADIIKKLNCSFQFDFIPKKGAKPNKFFFVDLKQGSNGSVIRGSEKATATFTMTEADFMELCMGKKQGPQLFMQGKMKIKGNMGKATAFTPALFPPPTAESLSLIHI